VGFALALFTGVQAAGPKSNVKANWPGMLSK
jgi:hypothetical protein